MYLECPGSAGWVKRGEYCYMWSVTEASWMVASDACMEMGVSIAQNPS